MEIGGFVTLVLIVLAMSFASRKVRRDKKREQVIDDLIDKDNIDL